MNARLEALNHATQFDTAQIEHAKPGGRSSLAHSMGSASTAEHVESSLVCEVILIVAGTNTNSQ